MLPSLQDFMSGKIKTLGWEILNWCSDWLVNPDGDQKGERWIFQPDQAHFILAFYAVDSNGEWIYRRAYRERAKGTGKVPWSQRSLAPSSSVLPSSPTSMRPETP